MENTKRISTPKTVEGLLMDPRIDSQGVPQKSYNTDPKLLRQVIKYNTGELAKVLSALGIASATVEYEGSGDEGGVSQIQCERLSDAGEPIGLSTLALPPDSDLSFQCLRLQTPENARLGVSCPWIWVRQTVQAQDFHGPNGLENQLEQLLESVHEFKHLDGYHNDEGGCGTLTLDAATASLSLEHSTFYRDSDTNTYEIV